MLPDPSIKKMMSGGSSDSRVHGIVSFSVVEVVVDVTVLHTEVLLSRDGVVGKSVAVGLGISVAVGTRVETISRSAGSCVVCGNKVGSTATAGRTGEVSRCSL